MSATEQVLLVCIPRNGGPVLASDARVDLVSGDLTGIANTSIRQAAGAEYFIRLQGYPARFAVDCRPPFDTPQFRLGDTQLAQLRTAIQKRGCSPCAYANRELPQC